MTSDGPQPEHQQSQRAGSLRWVPRWLIKIVLALLLAYFGYKFFYPSFTWSQTTTVTVSTPNGLRSGSSTVRVSWWTAPSILPDARNTFYNTVGEATVVDLGGGRYLFALMSDAESRGLQVFAGVETVMNLPLRRLIDAARIVNASSGQTRELPRSFYPVLVTFDKIEIPASVRRVSPADLSASFGAGYRLDSITMSISNASPTAGSVSQLLGWLSVYPERGLSPAKGETENIPFSRRVFHGDFIRR